MALIPFLLLGAAAVVLAVSYDAMPPRLVAHWGIDGPDRWVPKNWRSVYGVVIIGAAALTVLATARASVLSSSAATDWDRRFRSHHQKLLLTISFCCALLFCNIALAPIGNPAATPIPFWISAAPVACVSLWGLWKYSELQSESGASPGAKLELPRRWPVIASALALPVLIWLVAP